MLNLYMIKSKKFFCDQCSFGSYQKGNLENHKKNRHGPNSQFQDDQSLKMEPNITDAFLKVDEIKEEDSNDIPSNLANITSN